MDLREVKISNTNDRHPWELARSMVVKNLIKRFITNVQSTKTHVLDIGCGDTWLIEQLSKEFNQSKYIAVDIAFTDEQLNNYRSRLDSEKFSIHNSMDNAFKNNSIKIDLVLLLDVIEHIEDDISFLKWVQSFSKNITEETLFLITVPAFQSLFCRHDEFLGHYRRYTNKTLEKHVNIAGLEMIRIGYFFSLLLPFRWLISVKEKLGLSNQKVKGIGDWKSKPTDNIVKSILLIDYKINSALRKIGFKLPGLSNYILCRKVNN